MATNSKIGWTHHTMNFWWGCNKVSDECTHCYISGIMKRAGKVPFNGPMRTKNWTAPAKWNRSAERRGERYRIFTCSMSDFFHEGADNWRDDAWNVIRTTPNLDWLILTKRPERIATHLPVDWNDGYPNVWLGTTVGRISSLSRLKELVTIPAAIRFVSAEPLLEALDLRPHLGQLDWVITGCERAAKSKRRLMNINWIRDIDQQCRTAGVAHFFKQYYQNNKGVPAEDGMLDGVARQEFPTPEAK